KVSKQAAYIIVGIVVWAAVLKSGVHATLAGFIVAWFIPINVATEDGHPMLKQMEHSIQPWVAFMILPVFAFANAGVNLIGIGTDDLFNSITLGIALGLFLGKQLGIFGACWLAVRSGIASLPKDTTWPQLYGVCVLCGIGFTMSLFIGTLAFESHDPSYHDSVKLGVLLGSVMSAVMGAIIIIRSRNNKAV
ncbi:Na+/H+ antiporter NhaA, partial [Oleiphilus sp. HI0123]